MAEKEQKMADDKQDSPISVKTLRSELQSYREGITTDIKAQIESMHREIKNDISSLREEARAHVGVLRQEILQSLEKMESLEKPPYSWSHRGQ